MRRTTRHPRANDGAGASRSDRFFSLGSTPLTKEPGGGTSDPLPRGPSRVSRLLTDSVAEFFRNSDFLFGVDQVGGRRSAAAVQAGRDPQRARVRCSQHRCDLADRLPNGIQSTRWPNGVVEPMTEAAEARVPARAGQASATAAMTAALSNVNRDGNSNRAGLQVKPRR